MSLLSRLRAWWNKDELERAVEETRTSDDERYAVEEDYEAVKDDIELRGGTLAGGVADYERDSEPPTNP